MALDACSSLSLASSSALVFVLSSSCFCFHSCASCASRSLCSESLASNSSSCRCLWAESRNSKSSDDSLYFSSDSWRDAFSIWRSPFARSLSSRLCLTSSSDSCSPAKPSPSSAGAEAAMAMAAAFAAASRSSLSFSRLRSTARLSTVLTASRRLRCQVLRSSLKIRLEKFSMIELESCLLDSSKSSSSLRTLLAASSAELARSSI
mmetsp:Transcript_7787/g.19140  ORF Transcript_7787/g.19140 Transcript_7787/m.19140 type:complete len:206 (+) Transcript_7787:2164-2781(+)